MIKFKDMQDLKGKKIVVFDDDSFIAPMYKASYELAGFICSTFNSPTKTKESLIALVLKEKPDIIMMDIIMPDMSGYEAARILKLDSRTKNIPIIGFGNMSQKDDIQKAFEVGMDDYLVNTQFLPNAIVAIIKQFLTDPDKYVKRHGVPLPYSHPKSTLRL